MDYKLLAIETIGKALFQCSADWKTATEIALVFTSIIIHNEISKEDWIEIENEIKKLRG